MASSLVAAASGRSAPGRSCKQAGSFGLASSPYSVSYDSMAHGARDVWGQKQAASCASLCFDARRRNHRLGCSRRAVRRQDCAAESGCALAGASTIARRRSLIAASQQQQQHDSETGALAADSGPHPPGSLSRSFDGTEALDDSDQRPVDDVRGDERGRRRPFQHR